MSARHEPQSPLRMIELTIAKSARSQFVAGIAQFADNFDFVIRISRSMPHPDDILVQLRRMDVDIIGANDAPLGAPEMRIGIGFYKSRSGTMPPALDPLVDGLKLYLGQIEGAVFVDKK